MAIERLIGEGEASCVSQNCQNGSIGVGGELTNWVERKHAAVILSR